MWAQCAFSIALPDAELTEKEQVEGRGLLLRTSSLSRSHSVAFRTSLLKNRGVCTKPGSRRMKGCQEEALPLALSRSNHAERTVCAVQKPPSASMRRKEMRFPGRDLVRRQQHVVREG